MNLVVLQKLFLNGLPKNNYCDLCAVYLLEYEKMRKEEKKSETIQIERKENKKERKNSPFKHKKVYLSQINILDKIKIKRICHKQLPP